MYGMRLDARRLGLLLAAAADTSPRLARRWLAGEPVRHREAARLAAAADALGVRPDELGRETSPAEEP
jgi:hypothetical protein